MHPVREVALHDLRCLLDVAVRVPLAEHRWSSKRCRRFWVDLEPCLDRLIGPLHAIAERGHCDYVYRDPERFPGVSGPESFGTWAYCRFGAVRSEVEQFRPRSPDERADFHYMLDVVAELERAVALATELEVNRAASAG